MKFHHFYPLPFIPSRQGRRNQRRAPSVRTKEMQGAIPATAGVIFNRMVPIHGRGRGSTSTALIQFFASIEKGREGVKTMCREASLNEN